MPVQSTIATEMFYCPTIACVKFSVLLLYRRIFPNPRFRMIMWSLGAFIVCYSLVLFFGIIFQCNPIRGAWEPGLDAKCIDLGLIILVTSALNVFTDVSTLCLPLPLLWGLNLPKERKVQLTGIFLLGGLYVPPGRAPNNSLLTTGVPACVSLVYTGPHKSTKSRFKMHHVCTPVTLNKYPELGLTAAGRVRCRWSDLVYCRMLRRYS